MRAYILESIDAGPRLATIADPEPGADELLVRVTSSSVNPHDLHVISGKAQAYMKYSFPITLGNDIAGVVEAVGDRVADFNPGDRVFGMVQSQVIDKRGTFAEYVVVPAGQFVVRTPDGVGDVEAGAFGVAASAALACLEHFETTPGRTLFVNGATGGVGSYVIQIARARGARVLATARPGEEERHVRSLGATATVDWGIGDVSRQVRGRGLAGVDGLVDLVNTDPAALAELTRAAVREGGSVASTRTAADDERLPNHRLTNVFVSPKAEYLVEIARLAADGLLRAPIAATYELDQIARAHAQLEGGTTGKIALRIAS